MVVLRISSNTLALPNIKPKKDAKVLVSFITSFVTIIKLKSTVDCIITATTTEKNKNLINGIFNKFINDKVFSISTSFSFIISFVYLYSENL